MRRRVVITGMGCVTPLGSHLDVVWANLLAGRSGVGPLTLFDASNFPVKIAAEVRDWDVSQIGEEPRLWKHRPRQTAFTVGAATKAFSDAGLEDSELDPTRVGVYLGCGEIFQNFTQFAQSLGNTLQQDPVRHPDDQSPTAFPPSPDAMGDLELNLPASYLAARFNAQGPNANCIAACASASQAIGESVEIIRRGTADVMLAGGAHSMIHPFGMTGFLRLAALSTRNEDPTGASRPFERGRDGFVVGEGSAIVILEELSHALARGARIYGELSGFGSAQDAYRVTDCHPEGRGAAACIRNALDDARLNPEDIDYINAHGTGTRLNDVVETRAIKKVFGAAAHRVPVSSSKSMTGHFTTASGAVELVISLLAIGSGQIPPTINYDTPDPECDLDYVPNIARSHRCKHVLSNSFGFGGQNVAVVISAYEDNSNNLHASKG